jgi:hypothetical protein
VTEGPLEQASFSTPTVATRLYLHNVAVSESSAIIPPSAGQAKTDRVRAAQRGPERDESAAVSYC